MSYSLVKSFRKIKHILWLIFLDLEGLIDKYRLYNDFSGLKEQLANSQHNLVDSFLFYTTKVSHPEMAISYELSRFLSSIAYLTKPRSILDLGSGYSTYVFAKHKKMENRSTKLWSVDDDLKWLNNTRSYLKQENLQVSKLLTWKSFRRIPVTDLVFDLVLHDLGSIETRIDSFVHVLKLTRKGTLIIIDDMHMLPLNRAVKKASRKKHIKLYSLRNLVKDKYGRFASLIVC